jgi:hypothetical protein
MPRCLAAFLIAVAASGAAQTPIVRTSDPIKQGMPLRAFPRTVKVADNVYTTKTVATVTREPVATGPSTSFRGRAHTGGGVG